MQWRTGRNRHPLWKSLVLPASGVALCWLLLMTLLLPPLDYARSYRPLVQRIAQHVPAGVICVAAPGVPRSQLAALQHHGGFRVDAVTPIADSRCDYLLQTETRLNPSVVGPGWQLLAREMRNKNEDEITAAIGVRWAPADRGQ